MTIWFPVPTDPLLLSQLATGISFAAQAPATNNYIRRYLNDTETVIAVGTPVTEPTVSEDASTLYLRRYLCDPV